MVRAQRLTNEWRFQLIAVSLAAVLAVGGAQVVDRVVDATACRSLARLDRLKGDPEVDAEAFAATWLRFVASLQGLATASGIPPGAMPRNQRLVVGEAGTWDVAVLQVAERPRTLEVDFRDGGSPSLRRVPPGSGACMFSVSRRYSTTADAHVVTFTLVDEPSVEQGAPAVDGPAAKAFVDVVERSK